MCTVGASHWEPKVNKDAFTRTKRKTTMFGWQPKDQDAYSVHLDASLRPTCLVADDIATSQSIEDRCREIEKLLLQVGTEHRQEDPLAQSNGQGDQQKLRALIAQRREARKVRNKEAVRDSSKHIRKELRAIARARKKAKISSILTEFRGLGEIAGIQSQKRKMYIGSMRSKSGEVVTGRQEIADVFADFYDDLFSRRLGGGSGVSIEHDGIAVPAVTQSEVEEQLKKMSRRKACDSGGISVELLKEGGEALRTALRRFTLTSCSRTQKCRAIGRKLA